MTLRGKGNGAMRAASAALSARGAVTDDLVVGLASGPLHIAAIGHAGYARPDIIGPTVNAAFRVNGWAAAHCTGGIGAAFSSHSEIADTLHVVAHAGVALKGLAAPIDLLEITGRA